MQQSARFIAAARPTSVPRVASRPAAPRPSARVSPCLPPSLLSSLALFLRAHAHQSSPTMSAAVELPCHHCSLAYSPPVPAPRVATHPSHHDAPPAPLFRSPRPPERRRRQFRRARATGFCGQPSLGHRKPSCELLVVCTLSLVLHAAASHRPPTPVSSSAVATGAAPLHAARARGQATVGHLGPSRGLRRVRKGPLVLPRPSAADDVPSPAGLRELRRPPCSKSRQGRHTTIRRSSGS